MKQSKEVGIKVGVKEVAKKMLQKNMEIQTIIECVERSHSPFAKEALFIKRMNNAYSGTKERFSIFCTTYYSLYECVCNQQHDK